MKAYMIQVKVEGAWFNAYLCATKLEAQRKAQHWQGAVRVRTCKPNSSSFSGVC